MPSSRGRSHVLLPDPDANKDGVVDHPLRTGPFPFDVLSSAFLYLDDHDLQSLMAISQVCSYWRWVSNMLPQWATALNAEPGSALQVRDVYMEELRLEAEVREQEALAEKKSEYISDILGCRRLEAHAYVTLLILSLIAVGIHIGTMASDFEWPAHTKNDLTAYLIRRFKGFPGFCVRVGLQQGDECTPVRDIIESGSTSSSGSSRAPIDWICRGNTTQLALFEKAADYQAAGMSLHPVFSIVFAAAMIVPLVDAKKMAISSALTVIGVIGLGGCCALMLLSLPMIDKLHTTPCVPGAQTAEGMGWERSDAMLLGAVSMTILCALFGASLTIRREVVCRRSRR